jgi:hypothetical protein
MTIKRPESPPGKGLTRFNGFELLAWDFNPRWAMRSSFSPLTEFANRILGARGPQVSHPQNTAKGRF